MSDKHAPILCRIDKMVQIECFCLRKVCLSLLEDSLLILIQDFYFHWLAH